MAFGIENRCPFLDHRLVEYVASLPADLKIRNGTTKWIFREIAKGKAPDKICRRRMKMGFPTPVGEWFRKELHDTVKQWLDVYNEFAFFRKWIDLKAVLDMLAAHVSGRADQHAILWRILSIGCWLKTAGLDK
jgi:asparagine synthase (glutamine-hydrolysing)